ncbi:hypothetical protein ES705_45234 [subsurface metagenome]
MVWSEKENLQYKKIRKRELGPLYAMKGIPLDNPEARAEYLAEKVLNLQMTDHDVIMRMANKEGRAIALKFLEDMVIEKFF